jgi:23S rRNA (uridine2552-2'-O)-methyltransferase
VRKDHIKDFYFHKAKREKYSARSVYKLKNIQDKYHLIAKGNKILDLGAAPGSWTEYLVELLGKNGVLVSLDQRPLSMTALEKIKQKGVSFQFLQQSIYDDLPEDLPEFDTIVCDIAPLTSGPKLVDTARSLELVEAAYQIAEKHLKKGGHFVVKLFQSEDSVKASKGWQKRFKMGKLYKPPSTHKESKEIYFVGQHFLA